MICTTSGALRNLRLFCEMKQRESCSPWHNLSLVNSTCNLDMWGTSALNSHSLTQRPTYSVLIPSCVTGHLYVCLQSIVFRVFSELVDIMQSKTTRTTD